MPHRLYEFRVDDHEDERGSRRIARLDLDHPSVTLHHYSDVSLVRLARAAFEAGFKAGMFHAQRPDYLTGRQRPQHLPSRLE